MNSLHTWICRLDPQPTSRLVQDGAGQALKSSDYYPKMGYYPEDIQDANLSGIECSKSPIDDIHDSSFSTENPQDSETKSYLVQRISTLTRELNSLVSQLERL